MNLGVLGRRLASGAAAVVCAAAIAACSTTDEGENTQSDARSTPQEQEGQQPLDAEQEQGKALFVANCGACHTFDAAGTQGAIGPNLDEAQVDEEEVLEVIANGGKGSGNMPAGLVEGADAQAVAAFVANNGP